ncbi:MAG: alpha/beta hydrolase [Sedimenticola sp.]|nr:alpha/beta hydrolase [Sedimenticola sp.]
MEMGTQNAGDDCNKVLLLHGIWMTGFEMGRLKSRLSREGFEVDFFRYPSLTGTPAENAERLDRYIRQKNYRCLHLVAHSLGGLVLLNLFDRFPRQPPGRVVLLGSPVQGSVVARRLVGRPWTRPLIGRAAVQGLVDGAPSWQGGRPLGVIAGTSGLGVGRLLGGLSGASDGTVLVSETTVDRGADTRLHRVGHMGLLFSSRVAIDVAAFLRTGAFPLQSS